MIDKWGREIDYLRISLTDRCNLRCVYCMPEEGVTAMTHMDILTYDEIIRICRIMAEKGLRKIKLTGGEPLVRRNCSSLLAELKKIPGIEKVTLTTNGVLLKDQLKDLVEAGLDAVNISLDTLDRDRFAQICRRDELPRGLEGIEEALKYPQLTVKINCVPVEQDPETLLRLAELARKKRLHVRFIEMMPLGEGKSHSSWNEDNMLSIFQQAFGPAFPYEGKLGNGPGHYYTFQDFEGKIGFISAISHKFCSKCNRVRLTADGYLKACLQYQTGASLKELMRRGALGQTKVGCTDQELADLIQEVLNKKPMEHRFYQEKTETEEARIMAQIGG